MVEWIVFVAGAAITLAGAAGVITMRNPVHAALMLIMTLFGVAVLFVNLQAHFLAAAQVIVYAGAVVVLFLFVIMLLGVDRNEDMRGEPLRGQRVGAALLGVVALGELVALTATQYRLGVRPTDAIAISSAGKNVEKLAESVFTRYLFPFEITSVLLVIATVGAVVLARRPKPLVDDAKQVQAA